MTSAAVTAGDLAAGGEGEGPWGVLAVGGDSEGVVVVVVVVVVVC